MPNLVRLRPPRLSCLLLLAAICAASARGADDTADLPSPLTEYMGRSIAPYMTYHGAPWLFREERESEEHCRTLLKALELKPGQTVCDMGCGNGFYTLKLARLVGRSGRVLAVDIQPEMLRMLEENTKQQAIKNVELIQGSVIDPKLPEAQLDLILLADVYHEFSYPEQMLRAMRRALKPEGRLVLAEFRLEDPNVPIKLEHKMSKEQVKKELVPNGYKLVEEFDKLPWQHLMFFQRDDSQEAGAKEEEVIALQDKPGKPKRKPGEVRSDAPAKQLFEPDRFQTLVNPNCSHCVDEAKRRAGELKPDDRVLAWTRGKYEGGGIPLRFFLVPYRVISDTYGVFVYDADAGFARGFEPSLDFTFHGWRNGVMVIRHKDGTLFSTLSGRAFDGPRKGEQLKPIATIETDWGFPG